MAYNDLSFLQKREMQQYPGIQRLEKIIQLKKLHIIGIFLSASYDVHPGEHADTLVEMIKAAEHKPYYYFPTYKGRRI